MKNTMPVLTETHMVLPSPSAIAADIRHTPVTHNPVPHPLPPGAAEPSEELCEELFDLCSHPDLKLIRRLKKFPVTRPAPAVVVRNTKSAA